MKRLICVIFIIVGCSGGGGGNDDNGTAPIIESAKLYTSVDGVAVETLSFEIGDLVNFIVRAIDPDFDMAILYISQFLYPDLDNPFFPPMAETLPLQEARIFNYFLEDWSTVDGPVGHWRTCFFIVDSEGNESNDVCVDSVTN